MPTWLRVKCITTYLIYAFRKTVIYYCQLMIKKKNSKKKKTGQSCHNQQYNHTRSTENLNGLSK